jgi:anti-sigma factor RsiW
MTCKEVAIWLDEYADGEVSEEIRRAVNEHLETCFSCNRELREIRSLLDQAGRLPVDIAPGKDLWQNIETRIVGTSTPDVPARRSDQASWAPRRQFLAAAAVLVVALSIPLVLGPDRPGTSTRSPLPAFPGQDESTGNRPEARATAMLARSEDGVVLPRTDLLAALERRRDVLPPQVVSTIEENALLIDEAIAEVRLALIQRPNDRRLQLLLAARYQQEVALLERVTRV